MDLPCSQCLIFAICKHKDILHVMTECDILKNYLYTSSRIISKDRLQVFCNSMDRTLTKSGGEYHII